MFTTLRRPDGIPIAVNAHSVRSVVVDPMDAQRSIIVFGKDDKLYVAGVWSDIRDRLNSALSVA